MVKIVIAFTTLFFSTTVFALEPAKEIVETITQNSGSWTRNVGGETLVNKNFYYTTEFLPVGNVPENAKITSVVWSWALSYKPEQLSVRLCHEGMTGKCVDVTNAVNKTSHDFDGLPANQKMIFLFRINGDNKTIKPAYGEQQQVIVNYDF